MNQTYHLTCNTDDNYAQHCCAMLCSLFDNNKDMHFHVHLLTHILSQNTITFLNDLCERYNHILTIHDVDETKLESVKFRKNRPLTKAAYYRILLPDIIDKDIDKILYLDCDIIVLGGVKELYELNLTDYALAACEDIFPNNDHHRRQLEMDLNDKGFCSGVMMINLDYWRMHNAEDVLLAFANKDKDVVYYHDQDALNFVFKRQWYALQFKWNKPPFSIGIWDHRLRSSDIDEFVYEPKLIHYASGMKPWCDVWTPRRKYYLNFLKLSGFPNPKLEHVDLISRIKTWIVNLRFFVNRYVRPFVPNILEILLLDIYNVFVIIYTIIFKPKSFPYLIHCLWLKKYKSN